MRLRLFSAAVIALICALVLVACGGGESGSASTGGNATSVGSSNSYKPGVRLVCAERPCGSNPSRNESHGYYIARENDFPPETLVVITATYPDGEPYPVDQYTPPGKVYGVEGNVQYTDEYGELPEFKWATFNENAPVDPPGKYNLTFHFKYHGEVVAVHASLVMKKLS